MSFDGFISYSHAADGRLAPAVQRGLHRLGKPWHRRRALWIFRDQTGLAVTPALWSSIKKALNSSGHFVLLASPEAARSPWVNREIEHWVATKPVERILPVVTDGEWRWDPATGDFDESCTAVPPSLRGVFAEEPLYLDLRWARDDQHLTLRHSRFRDAIAQLAAPMHGISKDDLEGEDVRQHRRAGRLRLAAVTSLVVLSGLALLAGVFAAQNAAQANAAVREAQAQQREATEMRGSAARFADEATRQEEFALTQEARARVAATEADRQERQARRQKGAADAASAEAARQTAYADRAALRAREQERVAGRQAALARESAREMARQELRAQEQERLAREQQQLAAAAAAEAKRQEEYARLQEQRAEEAAAEAARQQENAERQERVAIGRRLVNEARAGVEEDPLTAVRMGIAAQRINPDADTRREVAGLITSTRRIGAIDDVREVEYGPGGLLATLSADGVASLWDVTETARPVRLSTIGAGRADSSEFALSRDGRTLALVRDHVVTLWDVTDPARPAALTTLPDTRQHTLVEFSPDGRTLVTGQVDEMAYGSAVLWDVTDRARPWVLSVLLSPEPWYSFRFAFTRDGRTLVLNGGAVEIWDVSDRLRPRRHGVLADVMSNSRMAMSPTKPIVAIGTDDGTVNLYDLSAPADPRPAMRIAGSARVEALEFSPDGRILASGGADANAILWELTEGYGPRDIGRLPGRISVNALAFSGDSRTVVASDYSDTAVLWSVAGPATPEMSAGVTVQDGTMVAVWNAPDGRSAITVGRQGDAAVWDLTGAAGPVRRATVPLFGGAPVESAAISADGRTVAAAGQEDHVRLTDLSDPAEPAVLGTFRPGAAGFRVDKFSPDGRTLLITGLGNLQFWTVTDPARPVRAAELPFGERGVGRTAFSPDGRTLVAGGGNLQTAGVWDVSGGAPLRLATLAGHGGGVADIAFAPHGRTLATSGADRTVILWDLTDRAAPRRLPSLTGHGGVVTAVAFSGDGKTVAAAATDSWVLLWDVAQPAKPVKLGRVKLGQYRQPVAMAFGPRTGTLAVGTELLSGAGHLGWWDLTALNRLRADPAAFGCTVVGRGLDAAEWARYVPELDYRKTCD